MEYKGIGCPLKHSCCWADKILHQKICIQRMDRGSQIKQKVDRVKRQRDRRGRGRSIKTLIDRTTLHVCI